MTRTPVILHCLQRTPEWRKARLGIPTASNFAKLVTPEGKAKKGATVERYIADLVFERLVGDTGDSYESFAMRRGTELEPHARGWYELQTGNKVEQVGFVFGDSTKRWGCSPDGLVDGGSGGIEIKCPMKGGIVSAMLGKPEDDYYVQAQGEMWICGAEWWHLVVYTEERDRPYGDITCLTPNPKMQEAFDEVIPRIAAEVEKKTAEVCDILEHKEMFRLQDIADHLGPEWVKFSPNEEVDISTGTMEGSEL